MNQHFLRRNRRFSVGDFPGFGQPLYNPTDWWIGNGDFSNISSPSNPMVNYTNVTFGTGVNSQAFNFNGANYAYALKSYILGPFTMTCWFNTTSAIGGTIFSTQTAQTSTSGVRDFALYIQTNGKIGYGFYAGGAQLTVSSNAYNDGKWHFAVVTTSDNGAILYVDGVSVGVNTSGGSISNVSNYQFYSRIGDGDFAGAWGISTSSEYFTGMIQDFRLYNNLLLSSAQIVQSFIIGPA